MTLMFAPPYSDNIAIEFVCSKASRRVEVQTFNPNTDGASLYLASDKIAKRFVAKRLPPDEFYGDNVISEFEVPSTDAVLAAFRASGEISKGSPPIAFRRANADELARIEEFFIYCEEPLP